MKSNLLLDIAELSLTHLSNNSSVTFVNINDLYQEFLSGKTLCREDADFNEFKEALKIIFPIYKNKRKHTVEFKISSNTAYESCEKLFLKLRPIADINSIKSIKS